LVGGLGLVVDIELGLLMQVVWVLVLHSYLVGMGFEDYDGWMNNGIRDYSLVG
jgi:hypothetical protein